MSSPYYVNDLHEPIWTFTAMTKAGAYVHAKRWRDKFGSVIIEEPMLRDDELWVYMVSNPFLER